MAAECTARPAGGTMAAVPPEDPQPDCFVCRKHREQGSLLPGGPVAEDDLVVVSHLTPAIPGRPERPVYLGHLLVEPRRHAPGLPDLTSAEAERVGWWCTAASQALRDAAGAEHVYAMVIGDGLGSSPEARGRETGRQPGKRALGTGSSPDGCPGRPRLASRYVTH